MLYPLFTMSNQDEPIEGPTGEYSKELAEEVEEQDTKKKTVRKPEEDTSDDTGNESAAYYGIGDAS